MAGDVTIATRSARPLLLTREDHPEFPRGNVPGTGVCDQTFHLVCPGDCPFCHADCGTTD